MVEKVKNLPEIVESVSKTRKTVFYRRHLPDTCVAFSSHVGKQLLIESLNSGFADIYFKLAAQFRTQEEPSFCGLSTLVMVLNALEVDPGRVWKGVWRWYHESMLDCCLPIDQIAREGINFAQLACLATCNRLDVQTRYADDGADIKTFRSTLMAVVRSEDAVMVASYSRQGLAQTGDGHFSPLAAYHVESDRVLIMDVARFKYPPHWVTVEALWNAMTMVDTSTGKCRGYMLMKLRKDLRPLLVFKLSKEFRIGGRHENTGLWAGIARWQSYIKDTPSEVELQDERTLLEAAVAEFASCMTGQLMACCSGGGQKQCCRPSPSSAEVQVSDERLRQCCTTVCDDVERDAVRRLFDDVATSRPPTQTGAAATTSATLAFLLRAWPYRTVAAGDNRASRLDRLLDVTTTDSFSEETLNEISMMKLQLAVFCDCDTSDGTLF